MTIRYSWHVEYVNGDGEVAALADFSTYSRAVGNKDSQKSQGLIGIVSLAKMVMSGNDILFYERVYPQPEGFSAKFADGTVVPVRYREEVENFNAADFYKTGWYADKELCDKCDEFITDEGVQEICLYCQHTGWKQKSKKSV